MKFIMQNRLSIIYWNRKELWLLGIQLNQTVTYFVYIIWPNKMNSVDIHAYWLLLQIQIKNVFSSHHRSTQTSGGTYETCWLLSVGRSLYLPPPPSRWCLFTATSLQWCKLERLRTFKTLKSWTSMNAMAQHVSFTLDHIQIIEMTNLWLNVVWSSNEKAWEKKALLSSSVHLS